MLLLLTTIITLLSQVLQLLALLDSLVQKCFIEGAIPSEEIDPTLFPISDRDQNFIAPVNGFTFDIEVEPYRSEVKRKRAIAKSPSGVVMLKGEWSFSSNDTLLIKELEFYIKQNNLKAD